jgi:hypothetical protein
LNFVPAMRANGNGFVDVITHEDFLIPHSLLVAYRVVSIYKNE